MNVSASPVPLANVARADAGLICGFAISPHTVQDIELEDLGEQPQSDAVTWLHCNLGPVFLPMTLITGIFGMNVAGLPGLHETGAFGWVMLLIGLAGGVTLGAVFWRRRS